MSIQKFQCPSCGAALDDPGTGSTLRCQYCSSSVVIPAELIAARSSAAPVANNTNILENAGQAGDRVFAYWDADEYYYPATIIKQEGAEVYVRFDDNQETWLHSDDVVAGQLEVDDYIECKWSQDGMYYNAQVIALKADQIQVRFEDGVQEWTGLSSVRIWFDD